MYESIDNDVFYTDAKDCLLFFGSDFMPDLVVKSQGIYLWLASGKRVLDWSSGQMSCLIGHGHPEVVETLQKHAAELDHLYSGMICPPVVKLAKLLTSMLPSGLDKAMFLSTGGESNECAIKLAKVYTGKFEIVGLGASWHGMTCGANGAQYQVGRKGYGPLVSIIAIQSCNAKHKQLTIISVRCLVCTCYQVRTVIGRSFEIQMALTTGKPNSTTDGHLSTRPRAGPSQR